MEEEQNWVYSMFHFRQGTSRVVGKYGNFASIFITFCAHIYIYWMAFQMKSLVPIMEIISDRFVNYIDELSKAQGALETKDLCTRFTVENVINSSFGLEANCFQPGISTFMDLSYSIFYPTFWMTFRTMCVSLLPSLSVFFDIRYVCQYLHVGMLRINAIF